MLRAGVFQAEYIAQHCYQVPHLGKFFFFFSRTLQELVEMVKAKKAAQEQVMNATKVKK